MTFKEWLASVPEEITKDVLWRIEVYRPALFAGDLAWQDVGQPIMKHGVTYVVLQLARNRLVQAI